MLEAGARLWGEARKCPLVIQSVLQDLKHSRECIVRKGINRSGIDRRCIVKEGTDRSGIDRKGINKEGTDRSGIDRKGINKSDTDRRADDVPENHRLHSIE